MSVLVLWLAFGNGEIVDDKVCVLYFGHGG